MGNSIAYLAAEVYNVTRRPDLVTQTQQAVREATMRLHSRAFYDRDIKETWIEFDECCFVQEFAFKNYLPTWRALRYFKHPRGLHDTIDSYRFPNPRPWIGRTDKELEIITPDDVFTYAGFEKVDVCYLSGACWKLRSAFPFKKILCGYFTYPNITADPNYSSWIADEYEFAVVHEAAGLIFKQIGLDAEYQMEVAAMSDPNNGWYKILDTNAVGGVGY